MKVEIVNKEKFTPIEIKLTIESQEELCNLWHRLNLNKKFVDESSSSLIHGADDSSDTLWDYLNTNVKRLKLYK